MEIEKLYNELLKKLKELYGSYDAEHHRFEKASNTHISRELGYSDSQFSRLINSSATEGEYERAIQNIDRILKISQLENQVEQLSGNASNEKPRIKNGMVYLTIIVLTILLSFWGYKILLDENEFAASTEESRDSMLKWTFETSFVNPYINLDQLPEDCNYPCYKYQGKWELKNTYKIPFFRERNGFHYIAKEVRMYARCMSEKSDSGKTLEGYEYQKHEIWYDTRELPIDSFTVNNRESISAAYKELDFSKDQNFIKVADLHTFFRNEFTIDSSMVHRKGKVIGRDMVFVPKDELVQMLPAESMVDNIMAEVNRIATDKLEDFSRPIVCNSTPAPNENFNLVKEGDEIAFDCILTTSRTPFNYTKIFVLKDQYVKNQCMPGS